MRRSATSFSSVGWMAEGELCCVVAGPCLSVSPSYYPERTLSHLLTHTPRLLIAVALGCL